MLERWADHTLYVVRHKYTPKTAFRQINQLYEDGQIRDISIVINDVSSMHYFQYGDEGVYGKMKNPYDGMYV
ncbi:MAG: hypothetical protein AAF206_17465 [Bacteroidota bacterium]